MLTAPPGHCSLTYGCRLPPQLKRMFAKQDKRTRTAEQIKQTPGETPAKKPLSTVTTAALLISTSRMSAFTSPPNRLMDSVTHVKRSLFKSIAPAVSARLVFLPLKAR